MRMRLGKGSWKEVLEYVGGNRSELRRVFHAAQRNRLF
jgi:DNA primase catalytic subunit